MKIRNISLFLVVVFLLVILLSACGNASSNNTTNTPTAANTVPTLKQGILQVGIDNTYPPMEFPGDSGVNQGFDIDVANAIAAKLGLKTEFVVTAWTGVFIGLDANKYDCIISSLSINEDRKKSMAMTRPYAANSQVIVVKADNNSIKTSADFKGKIIGVQLGTTAETACESYVKTNPFTIKKYDAMTEALMDLKIGRLDAVETDSVVGRYYVAQDKVSYKVMDAGLPSEPIGIGCKKENTKLMNMIDQTIVKLQNDGTLKTISEKWFGDDITSNIK